MPVHATFFDRSTYRRLDILQKLLRTCDFLHGHRLTLNRAMRDERTVILVALSCQSAAESSAFADQTFVTAMLPMHVAMLVFWGIIFAAC